MAGKFDNLNQKRTRGYGWANKILPLKILDQDKKSKQKYSKNGL